MNLILKNRTLQKSKIQKFVLTNSLLKFINAKNLQLLPHQLRQ
jgi:hypothetical protein